MISILAAIAIFFSPNGGCQDEVVRDVNAARTTVLVMAYTFTNAPIKAALVSAKARGVDVRVILDPSSAGVKAQLTGIPCLIDSRHAIMHDKVMVIDSAIVLTGSFNFSTNADCCNAENLLVIRNKKVAKTYTANWNLHAAHSL